MVGEKLPKPVKIALARIEDHRRFVLRHAEAARIAEEAADWFGKTLSHDESEGEDGLHVSIGWGSGSLQGVLVSAYLRDIRKIVPLLRHIRAKGFRIKEHGDYEELRRRTYHMRRGGGKDAETICVSVFLKRGKGAVCKYVQVGVEEKAVYELKCGDNGDDPSGIEAEVEASA